MAKYTMTLKTVMETLTNKEKPVLYNEVEQLISESEPLIFKNFPIYDEEHRTTLQRKILGAYLTREIGVTPVTLWLWRFNEKLQDIMPYYNELYKTAKMEYDPLTDIDYTRDGNDNYTDTKTDTEKSGSESDIKNERNESGNTDSSSSSSVNNDNLSAHSNTPQSSLEPLKNLTYASDATHDSGTSEQETSFSGNDSRQVTSTTKTSGNTVKESKLDGNSSKEYKEHIKGKTGGKSYSQLITEYRNTLLNIDMMIVEEMEELFMLIY